ncbi:hypothetical protein ACHAWO_006826 [Cyclotella atomus]|jgi:hypothetical protein|uniref:Transmembrane protein n=1 Tax=Cyclotella atomus TaxID=382360 RepID=A0ABD3PBC1_9STRA
MTLIRNIATSFAALSLTLPASTFAFHTSTFLPTRSLATCNSPTRYVIQLSQSSDGYNEPYGEEDYQEEIFQSPSPTQQQRQTLDPLVASLTRVDDVSAPNTPTKNIPFLGEIPEDGNLLLLAPAAAIAVLGFIFSIVVAFNARDSVVEALSAVEIPKMEYTPTVVEEGVCRGLCSSQETDLDGLRSFMQGLAK